ncbi:12612_t:CDS:2 [Funneliformis geosporum]|uniref:559_t:CDS:1 n=1 Tax=Funneliformis geosporum TaxID=1117311 RepID=A0A9W4SZ53_9GLOM|nr:12612_t:CDS:2 [Funneliformis geosporum]CAI2186029.1 559_t:CDS:2 [Funneliformis geosporum]
MVKEFLHTSYDKLEKVNPFLNLPQQLPIKILLLHGLEDSMLDWRATSNIYHQLTKDKKLNKGKINLYLCSNADHGDLPFIADFVPDKVDWAKAKEELIDCLGYFLGLSDFFDKTNDLYVEENEKFYNLENGAIGAKEKNTYYEWLKTFNRVCEKLQINEKELLNIYLEKYNKNLQRAHAK